MRCCRAPEFISWRDVAAHAGHPDGRRQRRAVRAACPGPALRYHAAAHGAQDEFRGAVQVQLFHDAPAVGLHRVQAQVEAARDFLVAVALGEELVDLAFAVGEELERSLTVFTSRRRAKPFWKIWATA